MIGEDQTIIDTPPAEQECCEWLDGKAGKIAAWSEPILAPQQSPVSRVFTRPQPNLGFAGIGEVLSLVADLLAQVFPNILRHPQENLNHFGIELAARPVLDFLACGGIGLS